MNTNTRKQAYEAPDASVDYIETEQCFLQGTLNPGQMQDMNWNSLGEDEEFDD